MTILTDPIIQYLKDPLNKNSLSFGEAVFAFEGGILCPQWII